MIGRQWGWIAAALLATAATPAMAQDKGEEICVTVARIWSGTSADVARIATVPVPDSFRRMFEGGGCTRFSLVLASLTEWNLAFGDEASTTAALRYLATGGRPVEDDVATLAGRIAKARSAADRDPGTADKPSEAFRRFSDLVFRTRDGVELAELYLRAAEFYGSASLLAQAEHYAAPALDIRRRRPVSAADPATRFDQTIDRAEVYEGQLDALEMHLAVVRAALTRDERAIAAAEAVMKAKESPFYRKAADEAYTHGDGFCDIGDRTDLADYAKACGDGNFQSKAMDWLRMRAQLDILKMSMSDDAKAARGLTWMDVASNLFRLFAIERAGDQGRPRAMERYAGAENEITLRLARADAMIRLSAKAPSDSNDGWGRADILRMAMDEMIAAEPLASPPDTPGRFRQIATTYLDAYGKAVALQTDRPGAADLNYPRIDRKAAYFRAMLPLLKPIAEARQASSSS